MLRRRATAARGQFHLRKRVAKAISGGATELGGCLDTERNFIRVELIDDPASIAEYWARAGHAGDRMICRRCGDADLTIAAILVVPAGGENQWALCAACLLEMP
jgi:hypothetical protein